MRLFRPPNAPFSIEILEAFRLGDADALSAVCRRSAPKLARYFEQGFSLGGDGPSGGARIFHAGEVEDLVQETLRRALEPRSRLRFNPRMGLTPWLRTIARRTAIDALRRRSRRPAVPSDTLDSFPDGAALGQGRPVLDDQVQARLALRRIARRAGQLGDRDRGVFELRRLQGRTLVETAARTGLSITQVRISEARAMAHIEAPAQPLDEPA